MSTKEYEGTFGGNRNDWYHDYGVGYATVYICLYSYNCTVKIGEFYCIYILYFNKAKFLKYWLSSFHYYTKTRFPYFLGRPPPPFR